MSNVNIPDNPGWYWTKWNGQWHMMIVRTFDKTIDCYMQLGGCIVHHLPFKELEDRFKGSDAPDWEWYGPFNRPGGDFGESTVIASEDLHKKAKAENKAIAITHVDYTHCEDEDHMSSVSVMQLLSAEDADKLLPGAPNKQKSGEGG